MIVKNGTALVHGTWYMVLIYCAVQALGHRLHAMSCLMARAQRARRAQELARTYVRTYVRRT